MGGARGRARFGAVAAVVSAGVVLVNLDLFVVNVALPDVGRALGADLAALSWVLNAYAIVFAALLVPAGRLADRTSRRGAYLLGVLVFAAASALCAAAGDVRVLVAGRALQALGGAMLLPSSLALLLASAPAERRVAAVRGWTAVGGVAAALGPVLGGGLVALSWRAVFLVNLPVAVLTLVVGARVLPDPREPEPGPRPDVLGALVLTLAVGLLALGLVRADAWGWASWQVVASLGGAGVLVGVFARRTTTHPSPVLDPALLRLPTFATATVANVLFAVAFAAMLLSRTLWCQDVWGWSAVRTGLAVAPGPAMVPLLAVAAGPVVRRLGAGAVALLGCVVFAAGALQWRLALGPTPDYVDGLLPGMLLTGVGVGLALPTLVGAAVSSVPPQRFATGSAVVSMGRQVGAVLGIALLVTVLGAPSSGAAALRAFDRGCDLVVVAALLAGGASVLLAARRTAAPAGEAARQAPGRDGALVAVPAAD